jgi:hypothetical protein
MNNKMETKSSEQNIEMKKQQLDVIYALDTTGSMGSWIKRSKETICAISEKMSQNNIDVRFNVIGYKDVCDRKCENHNKCPVNCSNSKWVQISGFTEKPSEIVDFLKTVDASGGGDCPEDLFGALQLVSMQPWRENAKRVVVVISDAPPHGEQFSNSHSNTPDYPLPYEGSKHPEDILGDLRRENVQVFMLYVENNTLEKTADFLEENEIATRIASLVGEPWKFSLIIPDDLTCMSMDVGDDEKMLVDGLDGPLSSAFFQLRRGLSCNTLQPLLENCFKSGMKDAMRLVLYIRDRTGDIKEKDLGRNAFWILRELDPNFASQYYKELVNDVGCVNDLLHLAAKADDQDGRKDHMELLFMAVATMQCYLKHIETPEGKEILKSLPDKRRKRHYRLKQCLNKRSLERVTNTDNIELPPYFIYKWLPKFGSTRRKNGTKRGKKWERDHKFATRLSKLMFVHRDDAKLEATLDTLPLTIPSRQLINFINLPKKDNPEREALYRELYSFLGKLCDNLPIEVPMCAGDWENGVDPAKATSGAQQKYKKCFARRVPEKLSKAIQDGKVKATTLQGNVMVSHFVSKIMSQRANEEYHGSLEDDLVNAEWETFVEANKISGNFSFQLDCTGSMLSGTPMPLTLAISLFLLSGEKRFISFAQPGWCEVNGKTLEDQITSILTHKSGIHGDIAGGLKLAMSRDKQPDVHFVLTDGRYPRMNLTEAIKVRNDLNKGELTRVVILNLRTDDEKLLVRRPDVLGGEGFYIVSGHSPALIKLFSSGNGKLEDQVRKMLREKFPLSD